MNKPVLVLVSKSLKNETVILSLSFFFFFWNMFFLSLEISIADTILMRILGVGVSRQKLT